MTRTISRSAATPTSPARAQAVPDSGAARADEGFWIAVLPFKYAGSNADLAALAEGLTDDIVTGMSRFSYLRVIARGSTVRYAQQAVDARAAAKELGARYAMEGNLRQAGAKLRLAVQLLDTSTGAHLWAETYERPFQPEAVFELQDDLVPRIVSTVADQDGILPLSMAEALRNKSDDQLTPHEAVVRSFLFFKRFTPEEHARVRQILETAVRKAPHHGDAWAMLSHLYSNEYWSKYNLGPNPLDRALDAARRAVDAAPSSHLSYWALALALYLRRELAEFHTAAERAIELNRMDGSSVAFMGALIAYSGDWERGCAIAEPASALNPNHAGWHKVLPFYNAYRKGEYRDALNAALRLNAPGSPSFVAHERPRTGNWASARRDRKP